MVVDSRLSVRTCVRSDLEADGLQRKVWYLNMNLLYDKADSQYTSYNPLCKDQFFIEDFGAIASYSLLVCQFDLSQIYQMMREHTPTLTPRYYKAASHNSTHGQH